MFNILKSIFKIPEPAGPAEVIHAFHATDKTITQDGISVDSEGLKIESTEKRTVLLYTLTDPDVEQCLLTYQTEIKTLNVEGGVYLEMWCALPGQGEFFSKGFHQRFKGTHEWTACQIPFYLKKNQRPNLIKLNIVFEGAGTVWLKNTQLTKMPLQ